MGPGGRQFEAARPDQILDTNSVPSWPESKAQNQTDKQFLESFTDERKATKGPTNRGEEWLRDTISTFILWLLAPLQSIPKHHIMGFLAQYETKPWRKRSMYLGLRTFCSWLSTNHDLANPSYDRHGNSVIEPPKTPDKVLYTMSPKPVSFLLDFAITLRDKAIISLFAYSGGRLSEISGLSIGDVDLDRRRMRVQGKGGKEGFLVFGQVTRELLIKYIHVHP